MSAVKMNLRQRVNFDSTNLFRNTFDNSWVNVY